MEFTLQELVQQTLAEAENRVKTAAAAKPEDEKQGSPAKTDPSNTPSTAPERNEEGISEKTATAFVEKLASAVQYLNENYLEKDAVGKPEPPTAHTPPQADSGVGAGKGTGAMPTNVDKPTSGMQSEETGQATPQQQPPTNPGQDVKSPGQVNPATAMQTDMNDRPGGSEDWTNTDKMKQAGLAALREAAASQTKEAKVYDVAAKKGLGRVGQLLSGSRAKGLKLMEQMGGAAKGAAKSEARKVMATRAGAGGLAAVGAGAAAAKKLKGKKDESTKEAQVARILDIMSKMAADAENPAKIGAKATNPHQSSPEGASESEKDVPSQPGEVSKQESMVGSNQSAIDYTKGQAKAVAKARMREVLDEPAQKKSTDPVLHNNLTATGKAGVKIASPEAGAAARALLEKIAEEGASPDAGPEQKERASKLQELLQNRQESQQGALEPNMPVSGGY